MVNLIYHHHHLSSPFIITINCTLQQVKYKLEEATKFRGTVGRGLAIAIDFTNI